MHRRSFLKSGGSAGLVVLADKNSLWASSADARIEVLVDEPVGTVSSNLYGHFTEHIGGVIYDGVWVGKNSKILAHGDRFIETPNFHVFRMYAGHQRGQAIRAQFSAPEVHSEEKGKPTSLWGLNGSASIKGKRIKVTAVNPDLAQEKLVQVAVRGAIVESASATVLASNDVHAHNTFAQPDTVGTKSLNATVASRLVTLTIPAAAVVGMEIAVS